jgi:hypothetical protein
MKNIFALILAGLLTCSVMSAQSTTAVTDSAKVADKNVVVATTDAPQAADTVATADDVDKEVSSFEEFKAGFAEALKNDPNFDEDAVFMDHLGGLIAFIFIMFGLPWVAVIVALFILFRFAIVRNRTRNEVINKAIENNYQLPESFFNSNGSGQKGASRNPKRFYSAWTLIAIGVPFIVLAFIGSESFFGLVGAICLLIGLGRMIGYYTISNDAPQYPRPPYGYQPPFQQPPYQQPYQAPYQPMPGQPNPNQPMNNQPMQNAPQPADAPQAPAPDVPNNDSNQRQTPPPYNPAQ